MKQKSPENNPCISVELIYNKRSKDYPMGKRTVSSLNGAGKTGCSMPKKITMKWIKDLCLELEAIKFLGNICENS